MQMNRLLALCLLVVANSGTLGAIEAPQAKFQFLKVGEVKPRGWLLDQMRADITNGFTPVLDQLTDRCHLSVFDTRHKADLEVPKIGGVWWDGETTGNWLDGFIRMAYLTDEPHAKARVDELVAQILTMQEDDGYLGCYPRGLRYQSPIGQPNNGELWDQACLFRGLLAYYELTGRKDVLAAVERAVQLTMSKYDKDRPYWNINIPRGGPGHNLMFVDVCEYLQRLTGDKRYVDFARFLYDGYNEPLAVAESDIQLRNMAQPSRLFAGHAAHIMEHLRVPLFTYYATGDEKYRVAVDNEFMKTARHVSTGGACIGDEDILQRLATPYLGYEHCTMFELLHSLQSGVEKTGRADLGDWIEQLGYNAAQGARLREGNATRGIQYHGSDNRYEATLRSGPGGRYMYSPTHEQCAVCCPPTAGKIYAYFTDYLWMRETSGTGLVAVAYAPSILQTKINEVPVTIESDTRYPFKDEVCMTLRSERPIQFSIRLRLPGWPGTVRVEAPGAEVRQEQGWQIVSKLWKAGDQIKLSFAPEIVRKKASTGDVYWQRGPLVYALPIPAVRTLTEQYAVKGFSDWDITPQPGVFWDYAVDQHSGDFKVERTKVESTELPWCKSPVTLSGHLLSRKTGQEEPVQLVPLGSSLLRRVAFPDMKPIRLLQSDANLARRAKVEASSTIKACQPQALVDGIAEGHPQNAKAEWASDHETTGAKIKLVWDKPVTIENIWLFDRPNLFDHVQNAWINFSDGTSAVVDELPNEGMAPFRLDFPEKTITWMEIIITRVGPRTVNIGFSEIAVFKNEPVTGVSAQRATLALSGGRCSKVWNAPFIVFRFFRLFRAIWA